MAGTRQANKQRIFTEPSRTGALARYEILEVIGGAERSQVYRARDIEGRPTVSITVLDSECALDAALRHRLLDEAHRASRLSHPRIASIYGAGEDRNHLYVISEDVAGTPLTRLLANRHLSSRRAIGLAAEIAATVADAHALGLAHCHLTADRVIVDATGAPILLGFGLATWSECARHARPAPCPDEATAYALDLAAIGSLLLDMAGHRLRSLDAKPRPASLGSAAGPLAVRLDPAVPSELDAVLRRALGERADDGGGSAAALAAELAAVAAIMEVRSQSAQRPPQPAGWRRWFRRSRV